MSARSLFYGALLVILTVALYQSARLILNA
jgi:hypothetical protein